MNDIDTTHPGFEDHAQMLAPKNQPRLDPNKQAPQAIKDTVWDIVNGKTPKVDDGPMPGQLEVNVPRDYVAAVAFYAGKELTRRGCTKGFSVKQDPDMPKVMLTWERPSGLATMQGNAFEQTTNCLQAYMEHRDPQHVGIAAAVAFTENLDAALNA